MVMWKPILAFLYLACLLVTANTETFLFQIPNYYDIPSDTRKVVNPQVTAINSSHNALIDHPIFDIHNYNILQSVVSLPYDFTRQERQTLLVKMTNFNNTTFDANDLINVKLCWPATTPVNFELNYIFLRAHDVGLAELGLSEDTLNIYIVVEYEADFYAVREVETSNLEFQLVISKLPNRIPIPIELYDVILYVVDVCILLAGMYPYILSVIAANFFKNPKRD